MKFLMTLLVLLLSVITASAQCGTVTYSRSYYSSPSYSSSYCTTTCAPSYGYHSASWYQGRFYPAGYYRYANGCWYRQGFSGPYYGLAYDPDAAVEVAPPVNLVSFAPVSPPVIQFQVPQAPQVVIQQSPAPTSVQQTTNLPQQVGLSSSDVQALVGTLRDLNGSIVSLKGDVAEIRTGFTAFDGRLRVVESKLMVHPK